MTEPQLVFGSASGDRPLISVVLPVFNGGEYLKISVESVLTQVLQDFELLIIDDCSTDESFSYLEGIADARVRLYRNEKNLGLFYNLNFLINGSRSPLIKLWAQDDVMYPECLRSFVEFHSQYPGIGFSYSGRDMIDEQGKVKPNNKVDDTPTIISPALHAKIAYYTGSIAGNIANVCINKDAFEKVGPFKEKMKISADFDMWVRLAESHETGFIRTPLIQLRDHTGQLSRNERYYINHVREDLEVYRYLDGYVSPALKMEGHKIMRKSKLVFYFTLLVKAGLKGNFGLLKAYYRLLASYENIVLISIAFLKQKISGIRHE